MKRDLLVKAVIEAAVFAALYLPLVIVTNSSAVSMNKAEEWVDIRMTQAASVATRGTAVPTTDDDQLVLVLRGTDKSSVSDRVAVLLADSANKEAIFSSAVDVLIAYMTGLIGLSVLLVSRFASYVRRWRRIADEAAQQPQPATDGADGG